MCIRDRSDCGEKAISLIESSAALFKTISFAKSFSVAIVDGVDDDDELLVR